MKFPISSKFGAVESVRDHVHKGVDIAMPMDTPLRAFCDGEVEKVVHGGDLGNGIIIKTKEGVRYIYGHLDEIDVHTDQHVHAGTYLGLSGSSGHSTGPHLHLAEVVNGQYVDPSPVVEKVERMAGKAWNFADSLNVTDNIQTAIEHAASQMLVGALATVGSVALHGLYAVALIGAGVLIVLRTLGFHHRWLKPSVLVGGYVMIRFMFGGGDDE